MRYTIVSKVPPKYLEGIEHLGTAPAVLGGDRSRRDQEAVGEGALAVVDVRDDAEVPDDRRVGLARCGHGRRSGHSCLSVVCGGPR